MKITKGIKIATANKMLCAKTLLARLVVTIIMLASILGFAKILIVPIIKSEEVKNLLQLLREAIKSFVIMQPDTTLSLDFKTAISNLLQLVYSKMVSKFWVFIVIFIIIEIMRFLFAIFDFIIGVNINEHMSSMRHAGFFNTLFENFKNACKYALAKVLFLFVYEIVVVSLMVLLFIALVGELKLYAFSLMMFLAVLAVSVRLAFSGQVLPKIVCENKSPFTAFKESVKEANFSLVTQRVISYFITSISAIVIVVVSSIVTFNVSYLITLPLSAVTFITLRFVDYFTVNHKKYYVTFDEVVIPKELRQNNEHLLNDVDI